MTHGKILGDIRINFRGQQSSGFESCRLADWPIFTTNRSKIVKCVVPLQESSQEMTFMRFDRKSHKYVINNAYVINNDPLACRFSSLMPFEEMQRYSSYICTLVH